MRGRVWGLALVAALAAMPVPLRAAETLSGTVAVHDGDRIDIAGRRVRLAGIDAPEPGQSCADGRDKLYACGRAAEMALAQKVLTGTVTCQVATRAGATLGICRVGSEDLGAWLVRQGLAVADRLAATSYAAEEDEARRAHKGLWSGSFTMPWDIRRGVRGLPDGYAMNVGRPLDLQIGAKPVPAAWTDPR